jgi:hypothetical protein
VESREIRKYTPGELQYPSDWTPSLDMRHKLEQILHTLDEPIVRMADQLSGLHDNFESKLLA